MGVIKTGFVQLRLNKRSGGTQLNRFSLVRVNLLKSRKDWISVSSAWNSANVCKSQASVYTARVGRDGQSATVFWLSFTLCRMEKGEKIKLNAE